jgi:hypothetical protein
MDHQSPIAGRVQYKPHWPMRHFVLAVIADVLMKRPEKTLTV